MECACFKVALARVVIITATSSSSLQGFEASIYPKLNRFQYYGPLKNFRPTEPLNSPPQLELPPDWSSARLAPRRAGTTAGAAKVGLHEPLTRCSEFRFSSTLAEVRRRDMNPDYLQQDLERAQMHRLELHFQALLVHQPDRVVHKFIQDAQECFRKHPSVCFPILQVFEELSNPDCLIFRMFKQALRMPWFRLPGIACVSPHPHLHKF